jgi:hypothetical protein
MTHTCMNGTLHSRSSRGDSRMSLWRMKPGQFPKSSGNRMRATFSNFLRSAGEMQYHT